MAGVTDDPRHQDPENLDYHRQYAATKGEQCRRNLAREYRRQAIGYLQAAKGYSDAAVMAMRVAEVYEEGDEDEV